MDELPCKAVFSPSGKLESIVRLPKGKVFIEIDKLQDQKRFIENLERAWKRCHQMKANGGSDAVIGMAFYISLAELFDKETSSSHIAHATHGTSTENRLKQKDNHK